MALGLWFTSTLGWLCSACGVVSLPEEGCTFYPAPSLPPGCVSSFANWDSPMVFNSLPLPIQVLPEPTALFTLLCLMIILTSFQRSKAEVQSLLRLAHSLGTRVDVVIKASRVKCSHLFADSVSSATEMEGVFYNWNTVTLRNTALLRGGFNPIIRGRYTGKYVNIVPLWVAYIFPVLCPFCVSQKWRKLLKTFLLNTQNTKAEDSAYVCS